MRFVLVMLVAACGTPEETVEVPGDLDPLTLAANDDTTVISDAWRVCDTVADCQTVQSECSQCCDIHSINSDFADDYAAEYQRVCEGYEGAVCDCEQAEHTVDCTNNLCTITFE